MTVQQKNSMDLDRDLVADPLRYGEVHKRSMPMIAYEHCLESTDILYRYRSKKRKPSSQTCRISQLLDFIRVNGLEPPEPILD